MNRFEVRDNVRLKKDEYFGFPDHIPFQIVYRVTDTDKVYYILGSNYEAWNSSDRQKTHAHPDFDMARLEMITIDKEAFKGKEEMDIGLVLDYKWFVWVGLSDILRFENPKHAHNYRCPSCKSADIDIINLGPKCAVCGCGTGKFLQKGDL